MNKFVNASLEDLLRFLCYNMLSEEDFEPFLKAFYRAYCASVGQPQAKIVVKNLEKSPEIRKGLVGYANYNDGVITINNATLSKYICMPHPHLRASIISTILHEHRHYLQDVAKNPEKLDMRYNQLCSKFYKSVCELGFFIFEEMMKKIPTSAEQLQKRQNTLAMWKDTMDTLEQKSYAMFPWEIDARAFTIREMMKISQTNKEFLGELQTLLRFDTRFKREFSFSMKEFMEQSHNLTQDFKHNPRLCNKIKNLEKLEREINDIYRAHNVNSVEDEKQFVKNIYSIKSINSDHSK